MAKEKSIRYYKIITEYNYTFIETKALCSFEVKGLFVFVAVYISV